MKTIVLGTRGFPNIQGGVESHCQQIYPRIVRLGCEVTVFTRTSYITSPLLTYSGVKLIPISCPKNKFFEAIVHTLKGTILARKLKPDMLHIHSIGPSFLIPLARLLGFKVVMTNHGPEYKRKKWGVLAKLFLISGECLGSLFANEIICISEDIARDIERKYGRRCHTISNGVEPLRLASTEETIKKYSLTKDKYVLTVGRYVPEKGFIDLIKAFDKSRLRDWKLVIVGSADHESRYSRRLREIARRHPNVVLTGFLSGNPLAELYTYAGLFVLPSYYEGLPIALLEAISCGLLCLASDIPGNRLIGLSDENYFLPGDINQLSNKLREFARKPFSAGERLRQVEMVHRKYNWDDIAQKTLEVYKNVIG